MLHYHDNQKSWESAYPPLITDFNLRSTFFLSPHRLVLLFADNKATTEVRVSRRTTPCGNHGNIDMVSTGSEIMLCWLDYSKPLKCAREAENSWAVWLLHPVQPWIEGLYFRSLPSHFQVTSVDCTHISLIPSEGISHQYHFHIIQIRGEFSLRFVL